MTKTERNISWVLQGVAAAIMLQTLFFKFTGAPETLYIFEKVGLGDLGRYGSGVAELVAGLALLSGRYALQGAALSVAIMAGAIASHLTVLGIEVQGDGGLLFGMALVTLGASIGVMALRRKLIPQLLPALASH
ncbi:MAG: DoxX family protein [Myxococcota bacterium]